MLSHCTANKFSGELVVLPVLETKYAVCHECCRQHHPTGMFNFPWLAQELPVQIGPPLLKPMKTHEYISTPALVGQHLLPNIHHSSKQKFSNFSQHQDLCYVMYAPRPPKQDPQLCRRPSLPYKHVSSPTSLVRANDHDQSPVTTPLGDAGDSVADFTKRTRWSHQT